MIDRESMREKAEKWGISLTECQLEQLDNYAALLVDWNTRMNLTGITDSEGIMTRHFEDSLTMLFAADIPENASVIDVGTGAGFPGMVLKIARPDLQLTLLDSLNKRLLFLRAVAEAINIEVKTCHLRAEEGSRQPKMRESFDVACARAVANMRELSEYCLPYVKTGGQFIALKGPEMLEELNAAKPGIGTLGGKVVQLKELELSDGSRRSIVIVSKIKSTPGQYPRTSAKIQKKPL